MTYFEGTIRKQSGKRGGRELFKATITSNKADHYWEDKIVIYAESIQEAEHLQCVILKALNDLHS